MAGSPPNVSYYQLQNDSDAKMELNALFVLEKIRVDMGVLARGLLRVLEYRLNNITYLTVHEHLTKSQLDSVHQYIKHGRYMREMGVASTNQAL